MSEQILINIVRPQAGVSYRAETPEAEPADELAACQLAFATLAHHMRRLYAEVGVPCHPLVDAVAQSDIAQRGLT